MVYSWNQYADGTEFTIPGSVLTSESYCPCEQWQLVARRTDPYYSGYPRVTLSGTITKTVNPDGTRTCSLSRASFPTHLGLKGYMVYQELWVMCAGKSYSA